MQVRLSVCLSLAGILLRQLIVDAAICIIAQAVIFFARNRDEIHEVTPAPVETPNTDELSKI